jgi:surface protein
MKLGVSDIVNVQLGNTQVNKVYQGADLVWEYNPPVFEFSVKTDNAGVSTSTQFRMPLTTSTGLNMKVDWGDDSPIENITDYTLAIHDYGTAGTYTISVTGAILGWQFAGGGDRLKMLNVSQWVGLNISVDAGFHGCTNLTATATDAPLITGTSLYRYFLNCSNFDGLVGNWDISNVGNLQEMFFNATAFNQYIGDWDTSSVNNMRSLFYNAALFNQDISTKTVNSGLPNEYIAWDTTNVLNMRTMFQDATAFNQDIGSWNVSNVGLISNFMLGKTAANYSAANLDSIYNGWSSRTVNANLSISFGSIKYTAASSAGRLILTSSPNNWTITDGGI